MICPTRCRCLRNTHAGHATASCAIDRVHDHELTTSTIATDGHARCPRVLELAAIELVLSIAPFRSKEDLMHVCTINKTRRRKQWLTHDFAGAFMAASCCARSVSRSISAAYCAAFCSLSSRAMSIEVAAASALQCRSSTWSERAAACDSKS